MANYYGDLPKHFGELNLAKQLIAFDDPKLHLWFSLDFIPGVRDIDILLWHEEVGVFVIEVKAVSLTSIEEFSYKYCKIKDRLDSIGPQYQAHEAQQTLRNYLNPHMHLPFIGSTACWPLISRNAWNQTWDDERVCGEYSHRMLFSEDLFAGIKVFLTRLEYIWRNAPVREGARYPFHHDDKELERIKLILSPEARPRPAPSDLSRLRTLEKSVIEETQSDVPIGEATRLLYQGYPGTGKTFRLLEIGFRHALAHQRVLFVCFNKVLAADIRRLLSLSTLLKQFDVSIDIFDLFDLLRKHATTQNLDIDQGANPDEWGELLAEDLKQQEQRLEKYDTILVDEAQDMQEWAFVMLEAMAKDDTTICIASGTGQELYGNQSSWMRDFRINATIKQLRRNFRNTRPVFQLAQVFFEAKMDSVKIVGVINRFAKKVSKKDTEQLMFERPGGQPPQLLYIEESNGNLPNDHFFADAQHMIMINEYERIIKQQLEILTEDERPLDLLVLVPDTKGLERTWALAALKRVCANTDLQVVDYTNEKNRRDIAAANTIRLCTFHSSRGLEGMRVVVFGFEWIEKTAKQVQVDYAKLGYIVLSRSLFENVIAVRKLGKSKVTLFVESILQAMQSSRDDITQQRLL